MGTIIVTTDFSASAKNALNYACNFAQAHGFKIALIHIFTIPATYAGEGLSLATINDELELSRHQLKDELERAKAEYPAVTIEANMAVGEFLESLQAFSNELNAQMIIMGAAGAYSELPLWDDDWLNAVIGISCPVLVIPADISYKPIKNIAFACDYKRPCEATQLDMIKNMVQTLGANLQIVHVTPASAQLPGNTNFTELQKSFAGLQPAFHIVEDKRIIKGISDFTHENDIDLLVVAPHRHGLWHSLFNKSYTKQLARLNNLPVLAIHE